MGPTPPYIFFMSGTRYTNLCLKSPGEWRACFSFLPLLQSWQGQLEVTAQESKSDTQTVDNDNITEKCSKLYCMVHARHTPTYVPTSPILIPTHIPTSPYPHPLTSPHTHTHTHTHMHIHTHAHTHISTHMHIHTCTSTHMHTHTHTHTHMHTHTHTHAHPHTPWGNIPWVALPVCPGLPEWRGWDTWWGRIW